VCAREVLAAWGTIAALCAEEWVYFVLCGVAGEEEEEEGECVSECVSEGHGEVGSGS
jgi:hypothetical protein